jgi:uncharacterized membrane protein YhaH (DUF805 family)
MYYIYEVFDKYRTYTGRARRKEFWHFYLFVGIILFGSYLTDGLSNNFDFATLIIGVVLTPPLLRRLYLKVSIIEINTFKLHIN